MKYTINNNNQFNEIKVEINSFVVSMLDIGATLKSVNYVTDGNNISALLEYKDMNSYNDNDVFLGSTLGRFAGRIKFDESLFSKDIRNNNNNVLHGGIHTSAKKIWEFDVIENSDSIIVEFKYSHKDDGFSGILNSKVRYIIKYNEIRVEYESTPNDKSICNITNHAYFNIGEKNISDLVVDIPNGEIALVDKNQLPTGNYMKIGKNVSINILDSFFPETRGIDNPIKFNGAMRLQSKHGQIEITSSYDYVVLYGQSYESKHLFLNTDNKTKAGLAVELQHLPNSPIMYSKVQKEFIEYKFM